MTSTMPKLLLTVKEFAELVREHPVTVYKRIGRDEQPGVTRIGRGIRIDPSRALVFTSDLTKNG